jgi:hypothetical protein
MSCSVLFCPGLACPGFEHFQKQAHRGVCKVLRLEFDILEGKMENI